MYEMPKTRCYFCLYMFGYRGYSLCVQCFRITKNRHQKQAPQPCVTSHVEPKTEISLKKRQSYCKSTGHSTYNNPISSERQAVMLTNFRRQIFDWLFITLEDFDAYYTCDVFDSNPDKLMEGMCSVFGWSSRSSSASDACCLL